MGIPDYVCWCMLIVLIHTWLKVAFCYKVVHKILFGRLDLPGEPSRISVIYRLCIATLEHIFPVRICALNSHIAELKKYVVCGNSFATNVSFADIKIGHYCALA